jgi:hypothetical protein
MSTWHLFRICLALWEDVFGYSTQIQLFLEHRSDKGEEKKKNAGILYTYIRPSTKMD